MIELKKKNYEVFPIVVPNQSGLKSINFYLIKASHSLTLIDAGFNTDDCFTALIHTLNEKGLTLNDLTEIVLTHHHIDHVGLVNRIVSMQSIPVYVHPLSIQRLKRDKDFLEMRIEFFDQLYEKMGCGEAGRSQVDFLKQSIEKNKHNAIHSDLLPIGNTFLKEFDVIHVPGHAPDQMALLDQKRKWLFSGDLLINHISSNALVEPDQNGERMLTLVDHMNSLKKCQNRSIDVVFPGHGILIEQPDMLIQKRLDGVEEKASKLKSLIQQGIQTANDLALAIYKKNYNKQFSLVMSEIIGHLDYLETQKGIEKQLTSGVWHYSIKQ
ncbi:MBL fold metallo-hydrolase [Halalkalibacter alkalisediminis]|uniref:MBL fold metallo-hydrolase n=1 Tax=Halalkalibacter alkalisediminis TaxID=935616 RepID=A0ABV6NCB2_9BACI|nr:MBL fold metallo-hydrolase [Halalkalibacter alkalisediminis]